MSTPQVTLAFDARDRLGEGVLWDPRRRVVWWIDLLAPRLHRFDPATSQHRMIEIAAEAPLGMIALTDVGGTLLLAHRCGISTLDPDTGALKPLFDPEQGRDGISYNDGKTDRQGRLWAGTCDVAEVEPRGALHVRGEDGKWLVADSGFAVSNGPAFSPDGKVIYFSDSVGKRILAYDIEPGDPRPRNRRLFAAMAMDEGVPDGLAVDVEGYLWCCHWDGWRVTRFAPDGTRALVIPLPAPRITSCAFGGPKLATLYVTSAREALDPATLAASPQSGGLFAIETKITGLEEVPFALSKIA